MHNLTKIGSIVGIVMRVSPCQKRRKKKDVLFAIRKIPQHYRGNQNRPSPQKQDLKKI